MQFLEFRGAVFVGFVLYIAMGADRATTPIVPPALAILFGGLFVYITFAEGWKEAWILLPIAALTIPTTKWGMKWQNERYVRSAKNQDNLEVVLKRVEDLENRISKLEEK